MFNCNMGDLKNKSIHGVFWSFIGRFGSLFIVLISQIIFARLLSPKEFGLIGMMTFFVAITSSFVNSGFGTAIVQKKKIYKRDLSTVFFYSVIISIILYVILFFTSFYIALFFSQPELTPLLKLISLSILCSSFGLVHDAILQRNMQYDIISKVSIFSTFFASLFSVILAFSDMKAYSLAIQVVLMQLFRSILLWCYCDWRPGLYFSIESFKNLFRFGSRILLSGVIDQTFQNIYLLIIGRFFSVNDVGFYTQAKKMQDIPVISIMRIVGNVSISTMSKLQDAEDKLIFTYRSLSKMLAFVNFPLMFGLSVIAYPLFSLFFGIKWQGAVLYFQLLCVSGSFYTLNAINLNVLIAKGRSDLYLKLEIYNRILTVISLLITFNYGIVSLIIGRVVCSFIVYFMSCMYLGRIIKVTLFSQVKDLSLSLIISILMSVVVFLCGVVHQSIYLLLFQILLGAVFYLIINSLMKNEALILILRIVNDFKSLPRFIVSYFKLEN